jgi:hypothetical protein
VGRQAEKLKREWDAMSAAEQLRLLSRYSLDVKRELLLSAVPQADARPETARERALLLAAADSTINQTIKVDEAALQARRSQELLPELLARIEAALKGG